jgi:hypothetical protein
MDVLFKLEHRPCRAISFSRYHEASGAGDHVHSHRRPIVVKFTAAALQLRRLASSRACHAHQLKLLNGTATTSRQAHCTADIQVRYIYRHTVSQGFGPDLTRICCRLGAEMLASAVTHPRRLPAINLWFGFYKSETKTVIEECTQAFVCDAAIQSPLGQNSPTMRAHWQLLSSQRVASGKGGNSSDDLLRQCVC